MSPYRLALSSIRALADEALARHWLSAALLAQAPQGPRRASWLAGRILLAQQLGRPTLPPLALSARGKPSLPWPDAPHFSLSHSDDALALLLSESGPVGCDLEVIRPRPGWPALAAELFTPTEQESLLTLPAEAGLAAFWRLWTLHEAALKQAGLSVWQMSQHPIDSRRLRAGQRFLHYKQTQGLALAICAETPIDAVSFSVS